MNILIAVVGVLFLLGLALVGIGVLINMNMPDNNRVEHLDRDRINRNLEDHGNDLRI